MKIRILSDLHLEFGPFDFTHNDEDILILAGDIDIGTKGMKWAKRVSTRPTVMIAGNHEFYGNDINVTLNKLREQSNTNVKFLENDVRFTYKTIYLSYGYGTENVRFICATLWTDYGLHGAIEESSRLAERVINDHRLIKIDNNQPFLPVHARYRHKVSRSFIEQVLEQPFDGHTVVVTHHLPSARSIHPKYRGDLSNPAFASDLINLILENNIDLWVHGHAHSSCDYMIGKTRVVCNPRGYLGREVNPDFDPNFCVEV